MKIEHFLRKWADRFALAFRSGAAPTAADALPFSTHKMAFSRRVTRVLNLLNAPLFWAGILFLLWLSIDCLLGRVLAPDDYARIAAVSRPIEAIAGPACVGYWTNWLAVKMLFRPRRRNAVWHGLVPARREEIVESLAAEIERNFLGGRIVRDYLVQSGLLKDLIGRLPPAAGAIAADPEFRADLRRLIARMVHEALEKPETGAMLRRLAGEAVDAWQAGSILAKPIELTKELWKPAVQEFAVQALTGAAQRMEGIFALLDEVLDRIPDQLADRTAVLEAAAAEAVERGLPHLDIRGIVRSRLDEMDEAQLEELLTGKIGAEMTFIQASGGIFGLAVALAMNYPVSRPFFLIAGLGIWAGYRMTVEGEDEEEAKGRKQRA